MEEQKTEILKPDQGIDLDSTEDLLDFTKLTKKYISDNPFFDEIDWDKLAMHCPPVEFLDERHSQDDEEISREAIDSPEKESKEDKKILQEVIDSPEKESKDNEINPQKED